MKKPPTSLPTFSRRKTLEKEKESKQQDVGASTTTTENEEPPPLIDIDGVRLGLFEISLRESKLLIFSK